MAIRSELLAALDDLRGRSVTVGELAASPERRDCVALRHDVDHDLDLALELAHAESHRELRATYFLLHTAPYWEDPAFELKVRQLTEYGHEVGLHVNALTEWLAREVDDVEQALREHLGRLRATGASVIGTAAHGDRRCYDDQYINYWMWRELRGCDPLRSESGLSPEGVRTDDPSRAIKYPPAGSLQAEGRKFRLWSISQHDHGIQYEAVRVPVDHYWSDTGGRWQHGDPFRVDLSSGRHQILVHPWWWRAEPRVVFCLATARSGSKWLANTVDRASSAAGMHDWTLNHERNGTDFPSRPRTRFDYQDLVEDPKEAARLIRIGFAHRRLLGRDAIEVNTYLEPFVRFLVPQEPAPTLVHLHRDGRKVVRSLLNRGWYRTPVDPSHRIVPIEGWNELSQLERACWYYRYTQERLMEATDSSISLERAVSDPEYLSAQLEGLGVVLHPLLMRSAGEVVDATVEPAVPSFEAWPARDRATFERICGPVQLALGYGAQEEPRNADGQEAVTRAGREPGLRLEDLTAGREPGLRLEDLTVSAHGVEIERIGHRLQCTVLHEAPANPHAVLAASRGSWHELPESAGLPCPPNSWGSCTIAAGRSSLEARVFALYFDHSGRQTARRELGVLRSEATSRMPLATSGPSRHVALALHFGGAGPGELEIRAVAVHWFEYPPGYLDGPVEGSPFTIPQHAVTKG